MNRGRPPAATRVGRRRGGIRQAAADRVRRSVEAIVQPVNRIPTYALLDSDAEEAIHQASMRVLEEIGVDFRGDPEALALWREVGAGIVGERVRIPRELAMAQLALAPAQFTQHARNPARSVVIGGSESCPRAGVRAALRARPRRHPAPGDARRPRELHQARLPAAGPESLRRNHLRAAGRAHPKRHLEIFRAHVRHSDKPFMGAVNAPERAMDCVEMARIVFGGRTPASAPC